MGLRSRISAITLLFLFDYHSIVIAGGGGSYGGGGGSYGGGGGGGYGGGGGGGGGCGGGGGGGCGGGGCGGSCGAMQGFNQAFGMGGFGAQMGAVCEFDSMAYYYAPECTLADAFPFHRIGGVSCDDCIKACCDHQSKPPFMCRSIVYDGPFQTCDLFAVALPPPNPCGGGGGCGAGGGGCGGGSSGGSCGGGQWGGQSYGGGGGSSYGGGGGSYGGGGGSYGRRNRRGSYGGSDQNSGNQGYQGGSDSNSGSQGYQGGSDQNSGSQGYQGGSNQGGSNQGGSYGGGNHGGHKSKGKRGGNNAKPHLAKYPGRIYLQPSGFGGCANGTQNATANATAACPSGQTAKLVAVKGYKFAAISGKDLAGVDETACAKACLSGQGPDGAAISCTSAQWDGSKCTISDQEATQFSDLTKADGATYYQRFCFPSDLVSGCGDIFEEDPQKILVGFARIVVDAGSYEECWAHCLNSQTEYGFKCSSGMFYYQDTKQNCMLNTETKSTHPDVFTDENQDQVTYFEPNCGGAGGEAAATGGKRSQTARRKKTFQQALLDLPLEGNWTIWSPCKGNDGLKAKQYRYRVCRETDVRKCSVEERECKSAGRTVAVIAKKKENDGHFDDTEVRRDAGSLNAASCRALVEDGKKNCRVGVRYVGNKRKYCSSPVDC